MRHAITGAGARVAWVLRADLALSGALVRTLLQHDDLPEGVLLLPTDSDIHRIAGLAHPEPADDGGAGPWAAVLPAEPWRPGHVPVATDTGEFSWISPADRENALLEQLARRVDAALSKPHPPDFAEVAGLEHLDGRLGGHPVAVAALLALAERHADAPAARLALGDLGRLRQRFHEAAPEGLPALQRAMYRTQVADQLRTSVQDALSGAAARADRPNGVLHPDAWDREARATAWRWWLAWRACTEGAPPRAIVLRAGLTWDVARRAAAGDVEAHEQIDACAALPGPPQRISELRAAHRGPPPPAPQLAAIVAAHEPRLRLFARQQAELERATSDHRLHRWALTQPRLTALRRSASLLGFHEPWQAAELAATHLRAAPHAALGEEPYPLDGLLAPLGIDLAATCLPFMALDGDRALVEGAAPVLFTTPAGRRSVGAARFAALHQLGHLVAGHTGGCTLQQGPGGAGAAPRSGENSAEERFANAFAAYFAAPRTAVLGLVGRPGTRLLRTWAQGAARDIAVHFGLSPHAALPHLLNCLERRSPQWINALDADEGWRAWAQAVNALVTERWQGDARHLQAAAGPSPSDPFTAALGRPVSLHFDRLLHQATHAQLIPASLLARYSA